MWRKTLVYLGLVEEPDELEASQPLDHGDSDRGSTAHPATTGNARDGDDSAGPGPIADDQPSLHPVSDLTEPVSVVDSQPGRGARREDHASSGTSAVASEDPLVPLPRASRRSGSGRSGSGRSGSGRSGSGRDRDRRTGARQKDDSNVRPLRSDDTGSHAMPGGLGQRVAVVAVTDYENGAREVGQRYRQSVPVVFDLTDAPTDDRRRVLDFVAGVTFALNGEMVKVGPRSFLIVPQGGQVEDAEWERLAGLGYRP